MSADRNTLRDGPEGRSADVGCLSGRCVDTEDTALRSLSVEDRARLSMDAWEPSLLRELLQAQDKLTAASRRRPEQS